MNIRCEIQSATVQVPMIQNAALFETPRSSRGPAHTTFLALRPRSRQGTPTAFWEGREHQRYSKAKETPSPRRSAYRRFILGHGVAAPPKLGIPLALPRYRPRRRTRRRRFRCRIGQLLSLHGGGETDKTTGAFAIFQMASADVTVTTVTGNSTS